MLIQPSTTSSTYSTLPLTENYRPKRQTNSDTTARIAETVTLSDTAKALAASVRPVGGAAAGTPPLREYPLEYYALPQWMGELSPVILTGNIGGKADASYVKGGSLVGKYDAELSEYGNLLQSHFQALMKNEGLDSPPKYHQAMIADKENSERLRLLMKESMAGDTRLTQLMNMLGINFPS